MDMATIAKGYIDLQKRSTNNLFDAVALFQDFADNRSQYWADQMGFGGQMKTVVDEWRVIFKKGRQDSLNLVNDGFNGVETYLDEWSRQKKDSQAANRTE
jgi:hypothetical protein